MIIQNGGNYSLKFSVVRLVQSDNTEWRQLQPQVQHGEMSAE